MSLITPSVEVQFSGTAGAWTDLTAAGDVVLTEGVTIRHGIDGSGPTDRVATTGTLNFALRNDPTNSGGLLGYYSLYHANTRSGWGLGIGCRVRVTDPTTAIVHTRFVGRIDAINPLPGVSGPRIVLVTAVDWMDEAARWTLTPAIGEQINRSWDQVLTDILAQMPRQPTAVSFDAGAETYPYALDTSSALNQPALAEFEKLASSEFGRIYQRANGTLRAEGRHYRMTAGPIGWLIADADLIGVEVPSTRDEIINHIHVTTHPKVVDSAATTIVYRQANVLPIAAGASQLIIGQFRDPVTGDSIGATDVQAPVASTDYTGNTASNGSGTDVTTDLTITLSVGQNGVNVTVANAGAATAYLTLFQLRGKGIYDRSAVQHEATDATSIADHGEHDVDIDAPYQGSDIVGQGAADYLLLRYKNPFVQARTVTVASKNTTIRSRILEAEISDMINVRESVTGINTDHFINGIELRFVGGTVLEATLTLAPDNDPFMGLYWILGTSTLGTSTLLAPF